MNILSRNINDQQHGATLRMKWGTTTFYY